MGARPVRPVPRGCLTARSAPRRERGKDAARAVAGNGLPPGRRPRKSRPATCRYRAACTGSLETLLAEVVWNGVSLALDAAQPALEFFHHGDTDPAGFDILRDLRHQTGITIHANHMRHADDAASVPLSASLR